jgi:hypothetical protein
MSLNHWIAIVVLALSRIAGANHILNATAVSAHDDFWDYEGAATGIPEFTCDMTEPHTYAIHTDPAHPNRGIAIDGWSSFELAGNETITAVYFNAVGRYTEGSSNCRFRAQALGTVQHQESYTDYWNQNDTSCEWRWPGVGWQINPPAGGWTADAVRDIDIILWRRTVDYNGPSPDWARIDGFQLFVQTATSTGNLWINGLYTNGDGLYYWNWPTPANPGESLTYTNFTFTNNGTGPLTWSISQPQDPRLTFSPSSMTLAVGQSVWMTATFFCDGQGDLAPTPITIVGGGGQRIAFSAACSGGGGGTGAPQITGLDFDEEDGSYGYYFNDGETSHQFTITNVGNGSLVGVIGNPGDSRLTFSPSTYNIPPGGAETITASFACNGGSGLEAGPIPLGSGGIVLAFNADCVACGVSRMTWDDDAVEYIHRFLPGQTSHRFTITNNSNDHLEEELEEPLDERLTFTPDHYSLNPGQSVDITAHFENDGVALDDYITLYECGIDLGFYFGEADPIDEGDDLEGDSEDSEGDFWGEGDYSISDFGGPAPESIFYFEHEGGYLRFMMESPQLESLGLALLSSSSPMDCLLAAGLEGDRRILSSIQPAGTYYLVVDGHISVYSFEIQMDHRPVCQLPASTLSFDPVPILDSGSSSILITNSGGGVLSGQVNLIDPAGLFSCPQQGMGFNLERDETLEVSVVFEPVSVEVVSALLQFGTGCDAISLTGSGIGPICTLDAQTVDFDTVWILDPIDLSVTVTNSGGGLLAGMINLQDTSGMFSCGQDGETFELGNDEEFEIELLFDPSMIGRFDAVLDLGPMCGSIAVSGFGYGEVDPEFDTEPYVTEELFIGEAETMDFTLGNYGNIPLNGTVVLEDASGMFYCELAGQPFTLDAMYDDVPDELEIRVYFAPTEAGEFSCTLTPCAECGTLEITGLAINPNSNPALPVMPGEPVVGGSEASEGNYWVAGDYGVPDFGGDAPESVFILDFDGGELSVELQSSQIDQLGLAVMSDPEPHTAFASAPLVDGSRTLAGAYPAGTYYFTLDGSALSYEYTLQITADNPNLSEAQTVVAGMVVSDSSSASHGSFWDDPDYNRPGAGGPGPEVVYGFYHEGGLLELSLASPQASQLHLALLGAASPDSCVVVGESANGGLGISTELPARDYFIVVDGDLPNYGFQLEVTSSNPNLAGAIAFDHATGVIGSSLDSQGGFWTVGDYGCPDMGGEGPEVVYLLDIEDHVSLHLELACTSSNNTGMALLSGASPDSCLTMASFDQDRWVLEELVAPGRYYLVIDSDAPEYGFQVTSGSVGIGEEAPLVREFTLLGNFPNPFNPATTISWAQPEAGAATLRVFNLVGQLVEQIEMGHRVPGFNTHSWNAARLSSGNYFYQVSVNGESRMGRALLVK